MIRQKNQKRRKTTRTLERQSTVIRELKKLALLALCVGIAAAIYVTSIPQKKQLERLNTRLDETEKIEQAAFESNERIKRELDALKTDSEYLEVIARDRLNLRKEGETIIRIER